MGYLLGDTQAGTKIESFAVDVVDDGAVVDVVAVATALMIDPFLLMERGMDRGYF